jgi:hypothetical protein
MLRLGKVTLKDMLHNVYNILDQCCAIDGKGFISKNVLVNTLSKNAYDEIKELADSLSVKII